MQKHGKMLTHFQGFEELLDARTGTKWISTLDLASAYNQVPVVEWDKEKTAFCTPFGLFE